MAFNNQDEINGIRSNASIVDVISAYIPLTQRGKNYFGVCPFHEDHSPSMSVSSEKQIYKCFSCGATGNVFTFVENYLNISFYEAVGVVAEKIGMSFSASKVKKKETKFKEEYDLMDFVLKLYQNNLSTKEGEQATSYLQKRGLLVEAIEDFSIGLSLDKNMLSTILEKKNYSKKMLVDLGLSSEKDGKTYDIFQNRIMFPIHNLDGQVVGFTARCYLKDEIPKYLNTKETYIFKKGNILFNYHRALNAIRTQKQVIVVEGNMDAIRMYASGIKNVIALMGTSLTKDQIEVLKKLRSKVILMLDNDNAGEVATISIGSTLEEHKIPFSVVRLSGEKDPDSYILQNGTETMLNNIKNAISFVDFKLNYFKKNKNLNVATDLADYIKEIIDSLKNSPDEILKEVTLQKLSKEYSISYAILKEQLREKEKNNIKTEIAVSPVTTKKSSYEKAVENILFYMMNGYDYVKLYQTKLGIFPTKEHRRIANEILYYLEQNKTINLADFISYIEHTELKEEIMAIIKDVKDSNLTEDGMLELIAIVGKQIRNEEIKKLKEEVKNEYDESKKIALLEKIAKIKKENASNV